jgi:hypothetical protein
MILYAVDIAGISLRQASHYRWNKKMNNEVIMLCRHRRSGGCCPTLQKIEADKYQIEDDSGGTVLLNKENLELICEAMKDG